MKPINIARRPISLTLLAACALLGATAAASGPRSGGDGPVVTAEREAAGEPCAVCSRELGPGEKAYQVKGRWIPLHDGECREELRARPGRLLAAIQPRGALFAESESAPSALRWGWFLAGAYVLLGLLSGALAVHMAYPRRRAAAFWFVMGLLFNLLALAVLAASSRPLESMPGGLGKIPVTSAPAPCPGCGATNHPAAAACAGCGRSLSAAYEPEARRAGSP